MTLWTIVESPSSVREVQHGIIFAKETALTSIQKLILFERLSRSGCVTCHVNMLMKTIPTTIV